MAKTSGILGALGGAFSSAFGGGGASTPAPTTSGWGGALSNLGSAYSGAAGYLGSALRGAGRGISSAFGGTTAGALGGALGAGFSSALQPYMGALGTVGSALGGAAQTTGQSMLGSMLSGGTYQPSLPGGGGYEIGPSPMGGYPGLGPATPFSFGESGMGGGGGGGGGFPAGMAPSGPGGRLQKQDMSRLVTAYNKAFAEAKAANERRYQEMLGIADKTTAQRGLDVRADYAQRESAMQQNLARLGMSGTTIGPTMGMGYEREQSAALDRLADQMQQTKLGIIERRADRYPDIGSLMGLGQMAGRYRGVENVQF